jgi:hypothetical protein
MWYRTTPSIPPFVCWIQSIIILIWRWLVLDTIARFIGTAENLARSPDCEAAYPKSRPFRNIIPLLLRRDWENYRQILDPRCPEWRQPLHALLLWMTACWVILDGFKKCKHLLHGIFCACRKCYHLYEFLCYMELNRKQAFEMITKFEFWGKKEGCGLNSGILVSLSSTKHILYVLKLWLTFYVDIYRV